MGKLYGVHDFFQELEYSSLTHVHQQETGNETKFSQIFSI